MAEAYYYYDEPFSLYLAYAWAFKNKQNIDSLVYYD